MATEDRVVLLVDDSADDRFLVSMCWEKAGVANPLVALENGQQAVDWLAGAERLPALVLLDLKMPIRNGFEVLAWMRADEACRRVPVIVMTASDLPGDVARSYDLGANAFVVKPSTVEDLVEFLRALKVCWLRFNALP